MMKGLAKWNALAGTALFTGAVITFIAGDSLTVLNTLMTCGGVVAVVGSFGAWLASDLD